LSCLHMINCDARAHVEYFLRCAKVHTRGTVRARLGRDQDVDAEFSPPPPFGHSAVTFVHRPAAKSLTAAIAVPDGSKARHRKTQLRGDETRTWRRPGAVGTEYSQATAATGDGGWYGVPRPTAPGWPRPTARSLPSSNPGLAADFAVGPVANEMASFRCSTVLQPFSSRPRQRPICNPQPTP
jgi:hypothetical protein